MQEPRSAGAMGAEFPYRLQTMCYIEVTNNGTVMFGRDDGTYQRACSGESRLYAVWPGQWSSHLFAIDDLDRYARAFDILHDESRTGLADHEHQVRWSIRPYENKPTGSYVSVDFRFECGCTLRDLNTFARQMREQKGWDVATTRGWSGGGTDKEGYIYSVWVHRTSLRA